MKETPVNEAFFRVGGRPRAAWLLEGPNGTVHLARFPRTRRPWSVISDDGNLDSDHRDEKSARARAEELCGAPPKKATPKRAKKAAR